MPNNTVQVHGAVILAGSALGLAELKHKLDRDFQCHHYRDNALLVADVTVHELPDLERIADQHACKVDRVHSTRDVRIAADDPVDPDAVDQPKQPNLDLMAGGWYRTNQDAFPLIHVIEVRNQVDPDGILLWLFDIDLVAMGALPQQATIDAIQLKGYSPKPASLEDFEDLDIAPPDGFEPAVHVIPSVEDELDQDKEISKAAGVSFVQAQMAAQQLRQQLGARLGRTEVVAAQSGFIVRAYLQGPSPGLLVRLVGGVPVRYCESTTSL